MNIDKIKEKLNPILERNQLSIYSVRTKKEFGEKILEILLYVDTMDINLLEKIHLEFQSLLTDDDLDPDYFLELSSLGAERPLKTKEDVEKAIGKYIYLESPKFKGNGTLIAFEENIMKVEINEMGRMKKIDIAFDSAKKMRTAVKF